MQMTEAEYEATMEEVRARILDAASPEARDAVAQALDEVVPKVLWDGIARNIANNSTERDPHLLIGLKMHTECVSIEYHRPARPQDPYRAISYLFN